MNAWRERGMTPGGGQGSSSAAEEETTWKEGKRKRVRRVEGRDEDRQGGEEELQKNERKTWKEIKRE